MANGLFIVLEGIDGTGKSSQARRLGEWFENRGREVVLSRESAATGRLSPVRPCVRGNSPDRAIPFRRTPQKCVASPQAVW